MTQPTQAQIEAAARVLYGYHGTPPSDRAQAMAKAALTAAAQVGEPEPYKTWADADREDRNATIERCVQVVERYAINIGNMAFTISAELRKLKDAP